MFKYTLAATLDEMDREGITVAECPAAQYALPFFAERAHCGHQHRAV